MSISKFQTIDYLMSGTDTQQKAYRLLTQYQFMEILHEFDPILAGTIPINIDIETSDLDIICCFADKDNFKQTVISAFSAFESFVIRDTLINEQESVVANFNIDGWTVELFGQTVTALQQNAYRHMIAEYRLLNHYGEPFREQIISLKKHGYKTEPAFAKLLGLEGDPYQALLNPELISSLKSK